MGMNGNTKLRLLNCMGFALRQGDDLQKIQTEIMEVSFITPVAFVLDEGGDIKCTVIKDRTKFEDETNIDRRVANVNNSFNVLWDQDGRTCTVYRSAADISRRGANLFPWRAAIISAIAGMAVGALICGIVMSDSEPVPEPEPDIVVERVQVDTVVDDTEGEPAFTHDMAEAENYIRKLQSENCTLHTVHKVQQWWNNMSDIQKSALSKYNIPERIEAYNRFFEAGSIRDISSLDSYVRQGIFSPRQQKIIEVYGRDARTFRMLHSEYGMNLRISPYELRGIYGKVAEYEDTAVAVEAAAPAADAAK